MANGMTIDDINKYFQDIYTINKGRFKGDFTMPVRDIRNLSDEQLINLLKQGERYFGRIDDAMPTTPEMDAELEQALLNLASERGAQTEQLYYKDTPYLNTFIPPREGDPLSGSELGFDEIYAIKAAQAGRPTYGIGGNYAALHSTDYPFEVLASVPEFAHSLIDDLIAQNEQEGVSTEETANFQNLIDLISAQRR